MFNSGLGMPAALRLQALNRFMPVWMTACSRFHTTRLLHPQAQSYRWLRRSEPEMHALPRLEMSIGDPIPENALSIAAPAAREYATEQGPCHSGWLFWPGAAGTNASNSR